MSEGSPIQVGRVFIMLWRLACSVAAEEKCAPQHYQRTPRQGADMAVDMFLKLGDIKGESRDQAHRDEIDIT
ncbi:hypothetical protein O6471_23850, partial [Salmonella enterica subsp. enterica]